MDTAKSGRLFRSSILGIHRRRDEEQIRFLVKGVWLLRKIRDGFVPSETRNGIIPSVRAFRKRSWIPR